MLPLLLVSTLNVMSCSELQPPAMGFRWCQEIEVFSAHALRSHTRQVCKRHIKEESKVQGRQLGCFVKVVLETI